MDMEVDTIIHPRGQQLTKVALLKQMHQGKRLHFCRLRDPSTGDEFYSLLHDGIATRGKMLAPGHITNLATGWYGQPGAILEGGLMVITSKPWAYCTIQEVTKDVHVLANVCPCSWYFVFDLESQRETAQRFFDVFRGADHLMDVGWCVGHLEKLIKFHMEVNSAVSFQEVTPSQVESMKAGGMWVHTVTPREIELALNPALAAMIRQQEAIERWEKGEQQMRNQLDDVLRIINAEPKH